MRDYSKRAKRTFYRFTGRTLPITIRLVEAHDAHMRALDRYAFRSYPGNITLIRATRRGEALSRRDDPTLGWQLFAAGELEIHDITSDHVSMLFEPQVRGFAEKLKTILANLEATTLRSNQGA
jgi:thioesterase domain-containing protein